MNKRSEKRDATDAEISAEFRCIQEAWKQLRPLDNPARFRALDWLAAIVRSEAGANNGNGDYC